MLAKTYSDVRNNLKAVCDTITDNDETVIVTRKNENNIVMMSIDQYNNIMENMAWNRYSIKAISLPTCSSR